MKCGSSLTTGNSYMSGNTSNIAINSLDSKEVHDDRSEFGMLETLLVTGLHLSVSVRYMMIEMKIGMLESPAGNGASF
ncbi:MAG TPA: hypothetical protein VK809_05900 [Bacteroidia bacterium]|nr:hypothetical protein [Bacteroidia bacterium]